MLAKKHFHKLIIALFLSFSPLLFATQKLPVSQRFEAEEVRDKAEKYLANSAKLSITKTTSLQISIRKEIFHNKYNEHKLNTLRQKLIQHLKNSKIHNNNALNLLLLSAPQKLTKDEKKYYQKEQTWLTNKNANLATIVNKFIITKKLTSSLKNNNQWQKIIDDKLCKLRKKKNLPILIKAEMTLEILYANYIINHKKMNFDSAKFAKETSWLAKNFMTISKELEKKQQWAKSANFAKQLSFIENSTGFATFPKLHNWRQLLLIPLLTKQKSTGYWQAPTTKDTITKTNHALQTIYWILR